MQPPVPFDEKLGHVFYTRLYLILHEVICHEEGPLGEVGDFRYRIEYQQRVGLHCHIRISKHEA